MFTFPAHCTKDEDCNADNNERCDNKFKRGKQPTLKCICMEGFSDEHKFITADPGVCQPVVTITPKPCFKKELCLHVNFEFEQDVARHEL